MGQDEDWDLQRRPCQSMFYNLYSYSLSCSLILLSDFSSSDLKVVDVDNVRQRVTVKLIPRIDLQALANKLVCFHIDYAL